MNHRLRRVAAVTVVPTVVDIGLLVVLREGLGWILVVADLVAIAVASLLSYGVHRAVTFRSDPFVRWVRMPGAFALIAAAAAVVDVVVLRSVYAAHELDTVSALVGAKALAVAAAALLRLGGYRAVLLSLTRRSIGVRAERPTAPGERRATVLLPALNEQARIGASVAAVRAALRDHLGEIDLEIVVIDDGSTDGTADAALQGGADQVVVLPRNRGKGGALRAGVAAARGRTVAFTDADLSYSPEQLWTVIAAVESGWDVVVGSRRHPDATTVHGAGGVRDIGSRLINLVTMAVLLSRPHDTQCGLKAFRSDVAKTLFRLGRVDRSSRCPCASTPPIDRPSTWFETGCASFAMCGGSDAGPPPAPTSSSTASSPSTDSQDPDPSPLGWPADE
jgi:putative flippase GtrA